MSETNIKDFVQGMEDYRNEKEVEYAGEYGKKHKKLTFTFRGSYKVYSNRELVLETMQPYAAVEKYLSL